MKYFKIYIGYHKHYFTFFFIYFKIIQNHVITEYDYEPYTILNVILFITVKKIEKFKFNVIVWPQNNFHFIYSMV